jgi:hypothetical protein
MTRLIDLRRRLAALRRRRQRIRVGTGIAGLLAAALIILATVFLLDWLFEMSRMQRVVLLALSVGSVLWAVRRYLLPWVGHRETDLQMALLVERHHDIDSDLIAALEFESPEALEWGSPELENAVIQNAAVATRRLNVMQGVSTEELKRRSSVAATAIGIWLLVGLLFPYHVLTFAQRMLLGAQHYPTRTVLESIVVNGRKVDPVYPAEYAIKVYYGQPVRFEVACDADGVVPQEAGRIRLVARQSGVQTQLPLTAATENGALFIAEWARPAEDVDYQVFLGDAWTDPGQLTVTQPPVVELQPEVIPPQYVGKGSDRIRMPPGLLQFSVVEGSQVGMRLLSDKWLKRAYLTINEQQYPFVRDETKRDDGRDAWVFENVDSPLGAVTELTRYAVQVLDGDDQPLEKAREGLIRIQADGPPRIASATVTIYVLPASKPTVYFRAIDDYGLGEITALREIVRADGAVEEDELTIYRLPANERPQKNIDSSVVFDFGTIKTDTGEARLAKGDTVKITLRAADFRGRQPGRTALAEPLVFQVTDEQGILAAMIEADRQSAQQLQTMIQRQLGIGDSP